MSDYVYNGAVARREARVKGGLRMVPASDRFVYCAPGAVSSMRMDGVAQLLDEPRLAEERFQTAEGRMENYDEFVSLFVPPFKRKTAQEWFEGAEAMHMTFALVQTVDDLFNVSAARKRANCCEPRKRPAGSRYVCRDVRSGSPADRSRPSYRPRRPRECTPAKSSPNGSAHTNKERNHGWHGDDY